MIDVNNEIKKLILTNEEIDYLIYAILYEEESFSLDRKGSSYDKKMVDNLKEKIRSMYDL